MLHLLGTVVLGIFWWMSVPSLAMAQDSWTIVIKDHQFSPSPLNIPAGKKIKLIVDNQDSTAEEFESFELNREKVVGPGKKIIIYVGPLKPGSYKYFGDFNPKTAQGVIVAQ